MNQGLADPMDAPQLDDVLRFKPSLEVEILSPSTMYLLGDRQRFVLSDPRAVLLAGLVDGKRTVRQILQRVRARMSEPEALFVLARLVQLGHLSRVNPRWAPEAAGFWESTGFDPEAVSEILQKTAVSAVAIGDTAPPAMIARALRSAGIRVSPNAPVQVVVVDDYLQPRLDEINRRALRRASSWCLVNPSGSRPLLGPFFRANGPCWECLAFYLRVNRPVEQTIRRMRGSRRHVALPHVQLKATVQASLDLAAVALAQALVCSATYRDHPLFSNVMALDLASLASQPHRVIRRPQCPACGQPKLTASLGEEAIALRSVEKAPFDDGGYRRQPPRQTYRAFEHLVSPLTGPVTHLVPVPGRDTELRAVYASGYMVTPADELPTTNTFDRGCAGKGCSADQAKVSALCEALERFSGVYQGDEANVRASTRALGAQALRLNDLLNFSDEQYRSRSATVATDVRRWIPEPLPDGVAIDWAFGWSLSHNERRYVPFAHCYAETPKRSGTAYCQSCGNGVAAGTCVEEALLQGLFELVERDAAAIWWYNRAVRPSFDLDSLRDTYIDAIRTDYARLGWSVWVLDLTHDLEIPVAVAVAQHPRDDRFVIGFGCHLEARLAIKRALSELNQLFDPEGTMKSPWQSAELESREYLLGAGSSPAKGGAESSDPGHRDLRQALESCFAKLNRRGLEVVAVNKTRPDIGLCVVQAVVPGLRHFWPRFGPGRLYSVPVDLGWRTSALAERQLNPVPLLL